MNVQTGFGYICPEETHRLPLPGGRSGGTALLLPLKPGKRAVVEKQLMALTPMTILFLSKLHNITVEIEPSLATRRNRRPRSSVVRSFALTKNEAPEGKPYQVCLEADGRNYIFVVHNKTFAVPESIGRSEAQRLGVLHRVVTIALPVKVHTLRSSRTHTSNFIHARDTSFAGGRIAL